MRICREGWPFIAGCFALGIVLQGMCWLSASALAGALAGMAFVAAFFCAFFFRDPARTVPIGERWILAPADGKILDIAEEPAVGSAGKARVVRIFLSIFEPHLQRSPVKGRVEAVRYRKGKFLDARDPQAAFENEQNRIEIQSAGPVIVVTQIAGLIARRIRCWVREGQVVEAGERIGLIQFGSQVDLRLPLAARLRVRAGDHVKAGETVMAEWPEHRMEDQGRSGKIMEYRGKEGIL